MRLTNIAISRLFGMFDHNIPLFRREPITIIHGPNGVGKTSILRLVYGILRPAYLHLRQVPFQSVELTFEDGTRLVGTPLRGEGATHRRPRPLPIKFQHFDAEGNVENYVQEPKADYVARAEQRLAGLLPVHHLGPDQWLDHQTNTVFTTEELVKEYEDDLPEEFRVRPDEPEWLRAMHQALPVHFIETQRLLNTKAGRTRVKEQSAVSRCSAELASHIQSTLAKYATLSQSLERSFPARLIGQTYAPMNEVELRQRLSDLDQRRLRLVEAGLLEAGGDPVLPAKRFDETTQRVLAVYIDDTEKKLAAFEDLLSRVELIKSIVDSRFLQKTVTVDRENGFVVKMRDGRALSLSGLSSGEQHELVLLYELLFRSQRNTLILIDEPELSLHIAWQQQFLRDLLRITKLATLQAVIATHSPQIIHDRWDLTVELTGTAQ